jgi:hypothetical protein
LGTALQSQSAQVDYGLTLGSFLNGQSTNSGGLFQLGTFSGYTDSAGTAFFTGKDYSALQAAWQPFAGSDVTTDALGQFYQSVDLLTTATDTRLFAWGFSAPTANSTTDWAIISGTIGGLSIYDTVWLAPSPSAIDVNVIELGVTSNVLYAGSNVGNTLVANSVAPSEGSAHISLSTAPEPPSSSPFLPPGAYAFQSDEKVKLGIQPVEVEGATYQWLKGGAPIAAAKGPVLDLTPSQATFGASQAGFYQLRVNAPGLTAPQIHGPWIITHKDPTVLVYNLTARGTQSIGASEVPFVAGGFVLLDREATSGPKVILIITRTTKVGSATDNRYVVEERADANIVSNGPLPGTAKVKPSRTVVTGLRGTDKAEPSNAEDPLWLAGDRDVLWLSGSDALVRLSRPNLRASVVAPSRLAGVMGTVMNQPARIDNLALTAAMNLTETYKSWDLDWTMDVAKSELVKLLRNKGFKLQGE